MVCWFMGADGPTHHNAVDGADFVRNELISEAEEPTHPLHIVPPPMTRAGTLMQVASGAHFFLRGRLPVDR
jgi:hypothetical protein